MNMTKLGVTLPTGEKVEAEIVRYFDAYGKKYLVYTLNEKDEQGFVKLYVAKVNGMAKNLVGEFIEDDNEWSVLKGEFKKIIGENSDSGRTSANDMDPAELENVNVRGHRIIKLMESYVTLLGANQKVFEPVAPVVNNNPGFNAYPEMPTYQPPREPIPFVAPTAPVSEAPRYNPVNMTDASQPAPEVSNATYAYQPQTEFKGYANPEIPATPFVAPTRDVAPTSVNYEEMYNELKAKLERCTAELEKVTNENIDLRIKIDDIREILNGN